MTIQKLSRMPYAQAHIEIHEDGAKSLFSYVTLVAEISRDGWLKINGLYSMTTRKHIGAFLKEFTPFDYSTAKQIYEDNMLINIFTGELISAAEIKQEN